LNILFITNSVPFPARHGVELPINQILQHIGLSHTIDVLVYGHKDADRKDYETRKRNVPEAIRSTTYIGISKQNRWRSILRDLFFIQPGFLVDKIHPKFRDKKLISQSYDAIWI